MHHHRSKPDAGFALILLVTAAMALVFGVFTIDFDINTNPAYSPRHLIQYPSGILFTFALIACWQLVHSHIRWWVYTGLLIPSIPVILFESGWFYDEFHDFALVYFRSHGRFGCHDVNYSSYLFKDTTAPVILYGPLIVATVLHWYYRSPALKKHTLSFIRRSTTYEARAAAQ